VLERKPGTSRGGGAQHRERGLRRQWPKVHRYDSPSHRRCTHVRFKRLGPPRTARSTVVHGATARRRAVRSALGPGVTSRWGARAFTAPAHARPQASARRSYLVPRSATCGGAAGCSFPAKTRRNGRLTESPRDVGECMDLGLSRSTAREGTAALAHSPCTKVHGATADPTHGTRTATAALKSTSGSGAPARRGTAVLRREGRHPGKNNGALHHDAARSSQEGDQGRRKKSTAVVVLTMGRRCRRCRLGEEGLAGEVDVHGDGLPRVQLLAPGPCFAPPVRRGGGAPPLSALTQGKRESKTPKGLVAWAPGSRPLLAFEARRRERRCESPRLPRL
jgi:hypothetical protein